MSAQTNIAWTDSTASPWFGCTEVSPGCAACYARELTQRRFAPIMRRAYRKAKLANWETRPLWGNKATRVLSKGFWKETSRWNTEAQATGHRKSVFPSLMDWLDDFPAGVVSQDGDHYDSPLVLQLLVNLIRVTPWLDWLLLTKRIEEMNRRLLSVCARLSSRKLAEDEDLFLWLDDWIAGHIPHNVRIGVSVENQVQAIKRIPHLPAGGFVSVEPMLSAVTLVGPFDGPFKFPLNRSIQWVIIGGESGRNRRDCGVEAITGLAAQCASFEVPVFVKQDCALRPGQQGRIPDHIWKLKQFPAKENTKSQTSNTR